jgi:hypothetical protein
MFCTGNLVLSLSVFESGGSANRLTRDNGTEKFYKKSRLKFADGI